VLGLSLRGVEIPYLPSSFSHLPQKHKAQVPSVDVLMLCCLYYIVKQLRPTLEAVGVQVGNLRYRSHDSDAYASFRFVPKGVE